MLTPSTPASFSRRIESSVFCASQPFGGSTSTDVTNSPRAILRRPVANALRQARPGRPRLQFGDRNRLVFANDAVACPRADRTYRFGDQLDVRRRRTAAAADEFRTGLNEPSREFGHVLRRAHVKLAALYVARQTGIRLSRKVLGRDAHAFFRGRVRTWFGPIPQLRPMTSTSSSSSAVVKASGVVPNVVLPSIWIVIWATIGRSETSRTALIACSITASSEKVSRTNRSTPPSSKPSTCSLNMSLASSNDVGPNGSIRKPERSDRSGDKDLVAGSLASDACGRDVDLAELAFESVGLQLVTGRTERVRLDDVGTGLYVFLVDLTNEVGRREVQLVVTAVDVNAFVVKSRADRTVKNVDVVGIEKFSKVSVVGY